MRRILLVLCLATTAAGVGVAGPAEAVIASCARPAPVIGDVKVGMTVDTDGTAAVCIRQDATTMYEVSGSAVTYTYGTDGIWGAGGSFCWYEGATYTCATAGAGGAFGVWATPDVATLFLMPSVCTTDSANPWDHCFAVLAGAWADGPLGPTTGVGGGVFVCEAAGGWLYCPVSVPLFEDLRDERQKVYDILEPITVTAAT